jgi:hypothetical protein
VGTDAEGRAFAWGDGPDRPQERTDRRQRARKKPKAAASGGAFPRSGWAGDGRHPGALFVWTVVVVIQAGGAERGKLARDFDPVALGHRTGDW